MALMLRRPAATVMTVVQPEGTLEMLGVDTPPAGTANAGAAPSTGPDTLWVVVGFGLVVVGAFASWRLFEWHAPEPFEPAAGISVFAPMYVIAQAIERLLEPFARMVPAKAEADGTAENVKKDDAMAKVEHYVAGDDLQKAANWQAVLDRIRRNTTVITWGMASLLAMLASGWFGFRLLHGTGLDAPAGIDVVITGLAIGSGTKPLHDLISNLQKSKDQKASPTESVTTN
jgi:hypothetical protein